MAFLYVLLPIIPSLSKRSHVVYVGKNVLDARKSEAAFRTRLQMEPRQPLCSPTGLGLAVKQRVTKPLELVL